MPTRPLLLRTFFSSQSIESYVSVPSSRDLVSPAARAGRCMMNVPSEPNFPRMSWNTKM